MVHCIEAKCVLRHSIEEAVTADARPCHSAQRHSFCSVVTPWYGIRLAASCTDDETVC